MEYVNLIDYLDKPEEIQHVGGSGVRASVPAPSIPRFLQIFPISLAKVTLTARQALDVYFTNSAVRM